MLAVLTNKENDHAGQRSLSRTLTQARPLEQRKAGRRQGAATAEARLVDPTKLQIADRKRDLAMFNLAIDSKLRGCDVVALKVEDIAPHGCAVERATVRQKKTGVPVRFEVTEHTRQAVDDYIRAAHRKPGDFLFAAPRRPGRGLSTRQYARLVGDWIRAIGLDPCCSGPIRCAGPRPR
jgi:integrase